MDKIGEWVFRRLKCTVGVLYYSSTFIILLNTTFPLPSGATIAFIPSECIGWVHWVSALGECIGWATIAFIPSECIG
jgi:hypothetical protein